MRRAPGAFATYRRASRELVASLRRAPADFDPDRLDARDPDLVAALGPAATRIARGYLRLRVEGTIDRASPALFVANHNGGIFGPDLVCTLSTLWSAFGADAPLFALAHDFAMRQLVPLGRVLQRVGAIRASPANARRALDAGARVLVYPGGDLDAYRHASRRDEIVFGPRTGFVRVAQDAGAPVVPVVAHGAHRSAYVFTEGQAIARAIGLARWGRLERFPIALALPWGIAAGPWTPYLPLPFPVTLRFLPARVIPRSDDAADARERLRREMQSALDDMARRSR